MREPITTGQFVGGSRRNKAHSKQEVVSVPQVVVRVQDAKNALVRGTTDGSI